MTINNFIAKILMLGFKPENVINTNFKYKDISIQAYNEKGIYIWCGKDGLCNHTKKRDTKDAINKILELL